MAVQAVALIDRLPYQQDSLMSKLKSRLALQRNLPSFPICLLLSTTDKRSRLTGLVCQPVPACMTTLSLELLGLELVY